ncbi:MAG TPA: TrkH family potassium uptake protein [Allocoleopsis sp.]
MTVSRYICLGFASVILIGAILLTFPFSNNEGIWDNFITSLFISTSAVCVTGLSVVPDLGKHYSFLGQFFIALLTQVGGLGYMTATTFLLLLLGRKFGLKERIAIQQSLDKPGLAGVIQLVKSIIATTLIFELTGAFLLMFDFVPQYGWNLKSIWYSIFHSVSAFNNAGFGLLPTNFMEYVKSPIVNFTIPMLIVFGGIGYGVIMEMFLWARDRSKFRILFSLNFKIAVSTTLFLLIGGTIAFLLLEYNNKSTFAPLNFGEKLMAAWFQSVTPRTAGFNTIDIGKMTDASLFLTIVLMFIGASPGGTGGGIKTTTFRVFINTTQAVLKGQDQVNCYNKRIPLSLILKAIGVFFGSLLVVIISTTLLELIDGKTLVNNQEIQFIQIIFESVSAFGTVGLSTGITPFLSWLSELVLIATMYIGRVGVLLLMSAILGDPKPHTVSYPEDNLLVG